MNAAVIDGWITPRLFYSWLGYVEAEYSLHLSLTPSSSNRDEDTIAELRQVPPNWTHECDEQLVTVLQDSIEFHNGNLGVIKNYVDAITVSTSCVSSS